MALMERDLLVTLRRSPPLPLEPVTQRRHIVAESMVQETDNGQSVASRPACPLGELLKHRRVFPARIGYRELHIPSHLVDQEQQPAAALRVQPPRAACQTIQNRLHVAPARGALPVQLPPRRYRQLVVLAELHSCDIARRRSQVRRQARASACHHDRPIGRHLLPTE